VSDLDRLPFRLRRADPGDHAALLALHRQHGWDSTELVDEEWAVEQAGEIVGAASVVTITRGLVYLGALVVEESLRGRGIGGWAMHELLPEYAATWWTECRESRIAFYARCGFELRREDEIPMDLRAYLDQPGVLPWREDRPHQFMSLVQGQAGTRAAANT